MAVKTMRQQLRNLRSGLVSRVRSNGRGLRPLAASSNDPFGDLAKRLRVRPALDIVHILSSYGERGPAIAMTDGLVERYPRSSRALAERAEVRARFELPGVASDLAAACAADLRVTGLVEIATLGVEVLKPAERALLRGAIAERGATDGDAAESAAVALEIIDVVDAVEGRRELGILGKDSLPEPILIELVARARALTHWDALVEILAEVERREEAGQDLDVVRKRLAQAIRAKGEVKRALDVARPLLDRDPDSEASTLIAVSENDLRLLNEGWTPPERAPRTAGSPGKMAYLLHNSLPHTSGGYSTRSHGLLASMVRRGWSVDAVTRPGYPRDRPEGKRLAADRLESSETIDGVQYSRILEDSPGRTHDARVEHFASRVAELAQRERWSVIHGASNSYIGLAGVAAAARTGLPSVYEVRGLWEITRMSREPAYGNSELFDLSAKLEADACRYADHSFAITRGLRSLMIERGVPEEHISLLPNGVDVSRFTPTPANEELRDSLGLRGKTVIGYVGSMLDYEGLELLVEAMRVLVSDGLPVALLLVGDGNAFESVKATVIENGLEDHVVMPGRVPHAEAEAYYSIIDIAPFPRLPLPVTELVSPLKPFEAMAMAKPVVVSSVAALTEIVEDGVNGRVFVKGDAQSLAQILTELVGDRGQRERLGNDGREWVVQNRSWDALSQGIVDVYDRLGVPAPQ